MTNAADRWARCKSRFSPRVARWGVLSLVAVVLVTLTAAAGPHLANAAYGVPTATSSAALQNSGSASGYVPAGAPGPITDLEQRLLTGLNIERIRAGLTPFAYDADAALLARVRSQQMVDQSYFGHVDPDGYTMYVVLLDQAGLAYQVAGEDLALNTYSDGESPERAVAALMRSASHRANILADDFFRIGVGEITAPDGRHLYTMIFLG